jgi:hypothetical protein
MSDIAKKTENSGRFKIGQSRAERSGRRSQAIEVFDQVKNETITYDSISAAARAINIDKSIISDYFSRNQQKPYKGQYTFRKL